MVVEAVGDERLQELDVLEQLRAPFGMHLHLLVFFLGEAGGFREDGVVDGDLADIVQHAAHLHLIELDLVPAEFACHGEREVGDAPSVPDGVVVPEFYGVGEHDEGVLVAFFELVQELGVSDGDGRGPGEGDEQFEVAGLKGVGGAARVDVDCAEPFVLVGERHAHGRGDILRDDALAGLESAVVGGVVGEHGLALEVGAVDNGGTDGNLLLSAA